MFLHCGTFRAVQHTPAGDSRKRDMLAPKDCAALAFDARQIGNARTDRPDAVEQVQPVAPHHGLSLFT